MDDRVDFEGARQKHAAWKTTIRDFLDDKISIEKERMVSHMHCDLGKWYYSEGKEKYGSSKSMQDIEYQNKKLHQLANDIYSMQLAGDESLPDWLTDELNTTSAKIIDLLNKSEQE